MAALAPPLSEKSAGLDSGGISSVSSLAGSPQPLLPTHEFPFPETKTTRTWLRHHGRTFLKRYWRRCVLCFILATAFVLMIYGFMNTSEKWDPTLRIPDEPLLVSLPGYGTFRGVQVVKSMKARTAFEEPVDAWLSVEYSTQPVNQTRFAPPDWPKKFDGIKDAIKYGKSCIQNWGFDQHEHAEECLIFNLYRKNGVPPETKLPVFLFLHGGSFVGGNGRSFDGAAFVAKSKEPLIVVTAQYRLGALGSLPSQLFEEEGLLNLGLRDQRMFLEFMQKYIAYFGGDKDRITLGGQSAGGHSIGLHLFHNYGKDEGNKLFNQAILASGAPTARSFPPATYPLYKRYYEQFMGMIGCSPSLSNSEALACIKQTPLRTIQQASGKIYTDSQYNITWPWQPVSGGPLLEKLGSISGENGTFFKLPTLLSSTTDEGKLFTPKNLTTNEHFLNWMSNLQPSLTKADLADLETLYPDPSNGTGPYANSPVSVQYDRVSAAYGDYSYICAVQETAYRLAKANVTVYKARFNTPNNAPASRGVPHASDAPYFNGLTTVQYPDIADLYSSYYASFVVSGNPNKFKNAKAPDWEKYTHVGRNEIRVGNQERGGVGMEEEKAGIRMEQCKWWRDEARMLRLNK
ncbi:alpha/beta-hydrolase [Byssothecium circinans]|uniref:Carboxylic ester hydrolase n=1 Tax=Byssothecium circinans TaxID=147558 RepID=A0A6A5UAF4_9PLEO|nr:alpha/beta-hydrolase [Byssothecium circinans]